MTTIENDRTMNAEARAKHRRDLKRRYSKMSVSNMHREHDEWCEKDIHSHEEYVDHAAVVSELDLLSRNGGQQINPEERQQRTPEQCVEFRQMYWNRYYNKPLEDIYWDREIWLRGGAHTVEEYRGHLDIVHEMQQRPKQPQLAVKAAGTHLEPPGEASGSPRSRARNIRANNEEANDIAPLSTPRRSSRLVAKSQKGVTPTKSSRKPSKTASSRRNAIAPSPLKDGAGVERRKPSSGPKIRRVRARIINDPAASSATNVLNLKDTLEVEKALEQERSVGSGHTQISTAETAPNPGESQEEEEVTERYRGNPKHRQLTAFERSLINKDGWRWYPHAAPLFPFAETRYIAALTDLNMKIDLALGPGT
ncbi:hypothetical protein EV356DRAFT_507663 [Viridothelium virens]|uniref:Uncharacterized protein n=1 Tax=Viridothelium virens TaxID=1048519 RepID=A0A6A6GZL2_VIRVR|nr:hypothetical protein EV356DRAFT_507663 [Viridothelium virens]